MSSKQSTSKADSRIAQKEAIVTRHKSAQMKRQLRDKNRSMKHLTDLLKSPAKETQISVSKTVQSKPKSPKLKSLLKCVQRLPEKVLKLSKVSRKKIALVQDEEYYPNKRKRKVEVKKVVLKASHALQMVGSITGSVKRKCGVPLKASSKTKQPKASSPLYTGLSMAEVIRIVEDDLTDEDMMEILTCPSPVWWEDPPDEEYIEDAVFTQIPQQLIAQSPTPDSKTPEPVQEKNDVSPQKTANTEDAVADKYIEITNLESKSDTFLKKRSKLEGLLGNIKIQNNKVHQSEKEHFNEDLVVICSNYRKSYSHTKVNKTNSDSQKEGEAQSESDGDDILFHDTSMNEDELLRDLENMDIPIENQSRQSDIIVIDDDDDDIFFEKTAENTRNKEISSDKTNGSNHDEKLKEEYKTNSSNHDEKLKEECTTPKTHLNDKFYVVPKTMPLLQKRSFCKELASPKSFDSISSKTSASSSQDIDSISDTNIRFLLDHEVEEESKNICVLEKADKIKLSNNLNADHSKNVFNPLDNPDGSNRVLNTGGSRNITQSFEKADKFNDLNKSHSKSISEGLEKTIKLELNNHPSSDDGKNMSDNFEPKKIKLEPNKDVSNVEKVDTLKSGKIVNTRISGREIAGEIKSTKDLNTSAATNINGFEKVEESKSGNILNTGDQKIESIESLKKYKNTSNNSITVYKIFEETNAETGNSSSNIEIAKENDFADKSNVIKINDYYKKCKKVYQKKSKKIEDTDINKNEIKTENETKFMLCDLCKPKTKKVSDDKNVKYCLKCSSIFDSKDCTYCIEKSKSKVYICVACKIKFCCEAFYFKHALEHQDEVLNF